MVVIRAGAFESSLQRLGREVRAILFYGADQLRIGELASRAVRKIAGSLDDPFAVQRLSEGDLSQDPGRLADEVASQSMLGGRRVVWFEAADAQFLKAVRPVLSSHVDGNLVVAEAGNLSKSSPLRALFEESASTWIVPVYEPEAGEIAVTVQKHLKASGLDIEPEACASLVSLAGASFATALGEAEKLISYCFGSTSVLVEDVAAVCGAGGEVAFDDVMDSVLAGHVGEAEEGLVRLRLAGEERSQLLLALQRYLVRLEEIALAAERGLGVEQAVRSARPAVFFKRINTTVEQLRLWKLRDLAAAAATVASAIAQSRHSPAVGQVVVERAVLSIAQKARLMQAAGN